MILYELKRIELLDNTVYKSTTPLSGPLNYPQEDEETKKKLRKKMKEDENYEYF